MSTHYHTLGVRPGEDVGDVHRSFDQQIRDLMPEFWYLSSMRRHQHTRKMRDLLEAYMVVGSETGRQSYDKKLREMLLICCMCDGRGWIDLRDDWEKRALVALEKRVDCAACQMTGWAA
jgi:hypothetical protein